MGQGGMFGEGGGSDQASTIAGPAQSDTASIGGSIAGAVGGTLGPAQEKGTEAGMALAGAMGGGGRRWYGRWS